MNALSPCRRCVLCAVVVVSGVFAGDAPADVHVVYPGESIRAAVVQAVDGDTILLMPGEYQEAVSVYGKSLTFRSLLGWEQTTWMMPTPTRDTDPRYALSASSTGTGTIIIVGVRFTAPEGIVPWSGVVSLGSGGVIQDCRFEDVSRPLFGDLPSGGAVWASGGLVMRDVSFVHCGTGVIARGLVTLDGCGFSECQTAAFDSGGNGAGAAQVLSCTFEDCEDAVDLAKNSSEFIWGCRFERCGTAIADGPAILDVRNSDFVGCGDDAQARDPLVHADFADFVNLENCRIESSHAATNGLVLAEFSGVVTVRECDFINNGIDRRTGVGIVARKCASVLIEDCRFVGNPSGSISASFVPDLSITACEFGQNSNEMGVRSMISTLTAPLHVLDCVFEDNAVPAITGSSADPCVFEQCLFDGNTPGVLLSRSGAEFHACRFERNTVDALIQSAAAIVDGCTFLGNRCGQMLIVSNMLTDSAVIGNTGSVQLVGGSAPVSAAGNAIVSNPGIEVSVTTAMSSSILWNNQFVGDGLAAPVGGITYCNIQGGHDGVGNIDADPMFVRNPSAGPDGAWGTEDDDYGDLRLGAGSPCIDAADSTAFAADVTVDLGGEPRFVDAPRVPDTGVAALGRPVVDMGAYEFQGIGPVCPCDFDRDGRVLPMDVIMFVRAWLDRDPAADLTGDGTVDVFDLLSFIDCFTSSRPGRGGCGN